MKYEPDLIFIGVGLTTPDGVLHRHGVPFDRAAIEHAPDPGAQLHSFYAQALKNFDEQIAKYYLAIGNQKNE